MQYRKFGNSFELSRLCFGGAALSGEAGGYGFGSISQQESISLIKASLEYGINFFDTAPIYGFYESEKRLGMALKGQREKVKLISKSGVTWHSTKRVNMTNDPKVAVAMLEQSLKNLQTDYIDFYMVHWPDQNVDIRFTLEALQREKEKGKIAFLGLCNTNSEELKKANEVSLIEIIQSEVNFFNDQITPLNFTGYKTSWGTFDKGILTGSVTLERKFEDSDCRSWAPWWKKSNWREKVKAAEYLSQFAKDNNTNLLSLSLGYALEVLNIDSPICGFKNQKQLESIISAFQQIPAKDVIIKAKELIDAKMG